MVTLAYLIALVLRYGVGCVPQMVRVLMSEATAVASPTGEIPPLEHVADLFGALDAWLVERGDELHDRLASSHSRSHP